MKKTDNGKNEPVRIRVVRLEDEDRSGESRQGRVRNTELVIITYIFGALFALLIGYMVFFQVFKRERIIQNVNNTRDEVGSDRVIRGAIVTENGVSLAYTEVDYTGNEIRCYPYENIFAHSVGYLSNGRSGLEASENSVLTNSHSPLIDQLKSASENEKVKGDNVIVTLNPVLQQAAYYALGSYRGAVVVMEPDSGKILAMVSKPDFNPNTISSDWEALVENDDAGALLNRATQGLYPPGSTFKILTTLAFMRQNEDAFRDFIWNCQGYLAGTDITITCYHDQVHGEENLRNAFANSCNTAYAGIGLELDTSLFRKTAEKFMFNKALPTQLQHSTSVFQLNRDSANDDKMTTAIGQGDTLVTPLHMALVTSAIANGGVLMKPYIISLVETFVGDAVETTKPQIHERLMTADEAEYLGSLMQAVVSEGTAAALSWNSYSVAGKTGSAEYDSESGSGTHSWFVGYSNVDDPDIVVAVIAEDGGTGSETAVPIAQQIFDAYYYS